MTEQQWIARARHGDADAFEQLVVAYEGPVYRLALRMCGSAEDAREVTQDAFLAAWRGLPAFRGDSRFSSWLYRLTTNAAIDFLRREKHHLGNLPLEDDPMNGLEGWQRLILRQSPALMAFEGGPDLSGEQPEQEPGTTQAPSMEPDDPEDPHQLPEVTTAPEDIVGKTLLPVSADGYDAAQGVYIENRPGLPLDVAALASAQLELTLPEEGPQVLIMHTHGSEAYTMPKGQEYAPTGTCRTADNSVNMIRVGDEIAAVLSSYGISVLHDRVLYDDPAYDGAYERAADAIRGYLEKYPTLSFVLDVHRDAIEDKAGHQYKVITREDPRCAQISFVMGSNNDHWLENVKLAVAVQQRLTDTSPTLMRPMTLRNSNYNQHLTTGSMLVEIGTAGNSLSEALRAAQLFAMGFAQVVTEK